VDRASSDLPSGFYEPSLVKGRFSAGACERLFEASIQDSRRATFTVAAGGPIQLYKATPILVSGTFRSKPTHRVCRLIQPSNFPSLIHSFTAGLFAG
jgi:hypothetical protein